MDVTGGSVPDRFYQFFGFVTSCGPPVYSTPHARVVDDTSTVIGEVDMSLIQGVRWDGVTGKKGVLGIGESGHSWAMESVRGDQSVSELQARAGWGVRVLGGNTLSRIKLQG